MGLTRGTNRCHIDRAALESITFQTNDVICTMETDFGIVMRSVNVDRGVTSMGSSTSFWRHNLHESRAPQVHKVNRVEGDIHGWPDSEVLI